MAAKGKYNFTNKDFDALKTMGYVLSGATEKSFVAFMQKTLPGFDVLGWLRAVESIAITDSAMRIHRKIMVDKSRLQVRIYNDYSGEADALIIDRIFSRDKNGLTIYHEYLVLPEKERNKGLARKILKISLSHYLTMQADRVSVIAGLSRGAYVWARHGFNAVRRADMERILKKARAKLPVESYAVVEAIYDHYYDAEPAGTEFPIRQWAALPFMKDVLMDPTCSWEGVLDLTNKEQLRKFNEYVTG